MNRHTNAVKKFKKYNAGWLNDDHAVHLAAVEDMAAQLDEGGYPAALWSSYLQAMRALKNSAPKGVDTDEDNSEELSQSDD